MDCLAFSCIQNVNAYSMIVHELGQVRENRGDYVCSTSFCRPVANCDDCCKPRESNMVHAYCIAIVARVLCCWW